MTRYFGLYRDDGNVVFEGVRSAEDLVNWLSRFQTRVNEIVEGEEIQFTMDIWKPGERSRVIKPKVVEVVGGNLFPYFHMGMSFDANQYLFFNGHTKPDYYLVQVFGHWEHPHHSVQECNCTRSQHSFNKTYLHDSSE